MHASDLPSGKRWNTETARRVLDDFAASGMSRGEFARSRGVNAQRLWWWRKRLAEGKLPKAVSFIPAVVASVREAAVVTVRLPGGIELEVRDTTALPLAWVSALARSLAGTP